MRDNILGMLLDNKEGYLSGEEISSVLGITRAGVWKHMKSLQEDGFQIEAKPRLGYRLVSIPETLDSLTLLATMRTQAMGRNIEIYETIGSTNTRAKELALKGAPEGTLIIAETQTVGKGRLGRGWLSTRKKGIWMSLILRPDIPPVQSPGITTAAAVAVRGALAKISGLDIGIKWPNDIILDGKKVCGILTEMHADLDRIHYIVVGVGINANQERDDFPEGLISTATSLKIALNHKVDRREIIALTMEEIERLYFSYIKNDNFKDILEESRLFSVTLGRKVKIIGKDTEFEGFALDFDVDGSLLVKRNDGIITKVMSGDVSVRGEEGYV
ncbi:MAG: biotin--[acetyl-CoA-carboxylase] ligase [Clostridiales bacterium]|nr:biotin--[acetyl-CoA-carboxylase] ligase [Clostridiales bacterium]